MKFISKTVIDNNTVEIPCGSFEIAMKKADIFAAPNVTFSEWSDGSIKEGSSRDFLLDGKVRGSQTVVLKATK